MKKDVEKWWDEASKGYQKDIGTYTKSAHYGPHSPDEERLKLLGNVKNKKILEIGCGGGQCSIAFAKQGAKCIGIDISKEQLKHAEKLAKKNKVKVRFIKGDIQTLKQIESNSQDIVFTAFSLQYVPNLIRCFREVYRVLKKKGVFVFSLEHPFYGLINPKTHKVVKSYHKIGKKIEYETWPNDSKHKFAVYGSKHKFVFYYWKVSDIYNSLIEAGFFVEKILEPFLFKKKDTWRNIYPEKLVKLVGPTIIFKARKKWKKEG